VIGEGSGLPVGKVCFCVCGPGTVVDRVWGGLLLLMFVFVVV